MQSNQAAILIWSFALLLALFSPAALLFAQPGAPAESAAIPASKVIHTDDFSDPSSGWDVGAHSGGRSGYDDGEYRVVAEPHGVGTGSVTAMR